MNQFRQLLENHIKRTETEMIFRSQSFFLANGRSINAFVTACDCVATNREDPNRLRIFRAFRLFRMFRCFSSLEILLLNFRYTTLVATG